MEKKAENRQITLQPLLPLESSPLSQSSAQNSKKEPIPHREESKEFSLDQVEQMELITCENLFKQYQSWCRKHKFRPHSKKEFESHA